MKKFQKINSLQNELTIDSKMDNPKEVTQIYPDDSLVITEKIDGENAQVRNDHGTLLAYSHHKILLNFFILTYFFILYCFCNHFLTIIIFFTVPLPLLTT